MRVLFVSGIDGFCHRYQVLHRAAQLASVGAGSTVRHFTDPRLIDDLATHDVLLAYRAPMTAWVRRALDHAGERGITRVAAIDDLIFVDQPDHLPSLEGLAPAERDLWRDGVRRYRATIEACDAFVAPTEPLVEVAAGLGLRAYLHRNAVSPAELELGRRARAARPADPSATPVLGYFSGTPSHDADFAAIARALADVLARHRDARLLVVGPLTLPGALDAFAGRIERRALVGWQDLPELVASVDVSLAPLDLGRRFAAAKGEIKYLEAAAVSVPTIASATGAYRNAIRDGANGRLASTPDDWRRALDELLADRALRARLGAAALADVSSRYAETARGRELLTILDDARTHASRQVQSLITSPAAAPGATFDVEREARVALEADAYPVLAAAAATAVSPPLPAGSRLEQRIHIARDGLCRVDVHTVAYGQAQDHLLRWALRRDDGSVAGEGVVAAADAPDRAWFAFELAAPEPCSAGRVYVLELLADGAESDGRGALSFGVVPTPADVARLDGAPLDGALALRGFAAWPLALPGPWLSTAADRERDAASLEQRSLRSTPAPQERRHTDRAADAREGTEVSRP